MRNKATAVIVIITLAALAIAWMTFTKCPDQIAIHWNQEGIADGHAPKGILFFLPFVLPLMDAILCYACKWDKNKRNQEKNRPNLETLRIVIAMVLFAIYMITAQEACSPHSLNIPVVASIIVGSMICICGNIMPRIRPNHTIGIRNPWTMHSENIWRLTHRFTGWIWFIGGIILCFSAFSQYPFYYMIFMILLLIAIPNLYAYLMYRSSKHINI